MEVAFSGAADAGAFLASFLSSFAYQPANCRSSSWSILSSTSVIVLFIFVSLPNSLLLVSLVRSISRLTGSLNMRAS